MALPAALQALYDRLQGYNGDPFNATTNPLGIARGGNQNPIGNFLKLVKDYTAFGKGISDLTSSASTDATTASNAAGTATTAAAAAGSARDKANLWANAPEDQEVETGKFSAFHFMRKAMAQVGLAANQVTLAGNQVTLAKAQADAAAATYDAFDDRYLGSKSADPTVDNDGNALVVGALYFNTSTNVMKVYNGSAWQVQVPAASDYLLKAGGAMTGLITFFTSQFASQADAEAGTDSSKLMTAQRVAQAIAKLAPPPKFESALLHVREEQPAQNGPVDTVAINAWVKRTLNAIRVNEIGAAISASQITLSAGTYYIDASAPAGKVNSHQTRLYNVTDAAPILYGTSEFSATADTVSTRSIITGRFTLSSQKQIRLEHLATGNGAFGYGNSSAASEPSIFSDLKLWKVA